jgi:S1-C subfamily serine protease
VAGQNVLSKGHGGVLVARTGGRGGRVQACAKPTPPLAYLGGARRCAAAEQAGLPEGLYVQAVTAGGPAANAGLRVSDVITKIDGEPATSNIQLQELTLTKKPGDTVPIEYSRDCHSATATVTLAAQP